MPAFERDVPRLRDRDVFRFFNEAALLIGASKFTLTELGGVSVPYKLDNLDDVYLATSDLFTIQNAMASVSGLSLNLQRKSSEPFADKLVVTTSDPNQQKPDSETIRSLNRLIGESFERGLQSSMGAIGSPEVVETLIQSHQQMLVQLQSSATLITETIAKAHANLEQEFARRSAQLDEDIQARAAKIDEVAEAERRSLREKEDALAQRVRELDDRDNTTARRAQHATLKSRIAERAKSFAITTETRRARLPVHAASVAACIVLLYFLYRYSNSLTALPSDPSLTLMVTTAIKPIGLTIALLGLVAWYLRWMNRWFERHADAEFQLKQFELDIDRANWVVETALEWKEKQNHLIPTPLLESISRNLFTKSERDEDSDMHPADYLASAILGRASNVNLRVPGGEISLSGKGIRDLQKEAQQ